MKTAINFLKWYLAGFTIALGVVLVTYAFDYVSLGFVRYSEFWNLFFSCSASGMFFGVSAWAFYKLLFLVK
jgi:hypothetical protein